MSSYQDFANAASRIIQHTGEAAGTAAANKGQIWGGTIANLGQVIPQQVQEVLKERAAKRKQDQINQIFQEAHGDLEQAIPRVMGIDPQLGQQLIKQHLDIKRDALEWQKLEWEMRKSQNELDDRMLGTINDEDSYARYVIAQKQAGRDVSKLPTAYDPAWVKQQKIARLSFKDQLEMERPKDPAVDWVETIENGKRVKKAVQRIPGATYEEPPDPTKLVPIPGPDGKPVYGTPVPGQPVYERTTSASGGSDYAHFLERYARDKHKKPEDLTSAEELTARRLYATADDRVAGAQAADITKLTPGGLDMAALNYKKTGVMPPLGMGDRTTRQQILNRAAELTAEDIKRIEAGGTDIAGNKADYKADSASLVALTRQRDAITAFENTAKKNIDLFLDSAKKVADTGIPLLNTPVRWIAGAGGSADLAKYNAARQVAISEIARIVQNPNLTGQLSDTARREIEVFNPANATLRQTVAVMELLKQDMANRKQSLDDQVREIRSRIGSTAAPAQSRTPTVGSLVMWQGKRYRVKAITNGQAELEAVP